jgi:hypothetical protein
LLFSFNTLSFECCDKRVYISLSINSCKLFSEASFKAIDMENSSIIVLTICSSLDVFSFIRSVDLDFNSSNFCFESSSSF